MQTIWNAHNSGAAAIHSLHTKFDFPNITCLIVMDEINEWKREMDDIQCNKDKQFVRQKCVIDCCLEEASTKSRWRCLQNLQLTRAESGSVSYPQIHLDGNFHYYRDSDLSTGFRCCKFFFKRGGNQQLNYLQRRKLKGFSQFCFELQSSVLKVSDGEFIQSIIVQVQAKST